MRQELSHGGSILATMPPTEIVTGDVAGLEDAFADAVLKARTPDPLAPVTVLVGHVLLRPYLRRMLAARGIAHLNLRFVQAQELAEQLAAGSVDAGKPRLSPAARRMLVRETAADAGGYFAQVGGREGFADALGRLLRELEQGGVSAEDVAQGVEQCVAHSGGNDAKLRELARLYAAYESRRSSFVAAPDFFRAADASPFEGALLVYGLWEKPGDAVLGLVERVAAVAPVTVFLPRADASDGEATAAVRERLLAAAASERATDRTRDDALAGRLFGVADDEPARRGSTEIALVSAPDTVREVWEAARACVRWAEEGLRFHEMAVGYRNRDPYAALVDEIFREAGIETYLHDGRPVAWHPVGRRLLALIELAESGEFSRAGVMEFLTETRVSHEVRDAYAPFRPSEWEGFTREAGVIAGAAQWDERLGRLAEEKREQAKLEGQEWRAEHVERIDTLRKFAGDFDAELRAHPSDGTWDEHLAFVRTLASRFAPDAAPAVEALRELLALSAVEERPSFATFCRAVKDDLESRDVTRVFGEPVREFGKRGVAVLDATSLRQLRFRAVYMLGVAERAWPPPPRPDPLLLEHEREALNRHIAQALPMRTEPDGEPLTFWLGTQAARESMVVSYARADAGRSGKHLPSFFFRAVVEGLEGRSVAVSEIEASAHVRRFGAGRLTADDIGDSLSQAEYDRGLVRETAGAAALAADTPSFGRAIDAREERWRNALTAFDGVMLERRGSRGGARAVELRAGEGIVAEPDGDVRDVPVPVLPQVHAGHRAAGGAGDD